MKSGLGRIQNWGTSARAVLAVVPLVLLICGVLGIRVVEQGERANRAKQLSTSAERISRLAALHGSVTTESFVSGTLFGIIDAGVKPSQAAFLLGFNPEERLVEARVAVDQRLAAFAPTDISDVRGALTFSRQRLDSRSEEFRFDAVRLTQAALDAETAKISVASDGLIDSNQASSLIAAADAVDAGLDQMSSMSDVVRNEGNRTERLAVALQAGSRLDDDLERYAATSEDFAEQANRVREQSAYIAMAKLTDEVLTSALAGNTSMNPMMLARPSRQGDERTQMLTELVTFAADKIGESADRVETDAEKSIYVSLGLIVAALAVFLIGFRIHRSLIAKPIQALGDQAQRMLEAGTLQLLAEAGPSEIVQATSAMNELTKTLRQLELQADALARGDLADPVLERPAPGAIGASLHRAVARLSSNMVGQRTRTEELVAAASHDQLTGLLNRAGWQQAVDSIENDAKVHIVMADLDRFKAVNDRHGHVVGDEVLIEVARRLRRVVREIDAVCRLGGDEFVILLEGVTTEQAESVRVRIGSSIGAPIATSVGWVEIGISVGVAYGRAAEVAGLVHRADTLVYAEKQLRAGV